jgi:hypothetical protein
MLKRVIAVAVVFIGAFAAPAAAQQYPPAVTSLALSDTCAPAGATVTATARTFTPGTMVNLAVAGTPVGSAAADGSGIATLTVTVPQADGDIELVATGDGPDGALTLTAHLTVDADDCASAAPSPEPAPAAPSAPGGDVDSDGGGNLPRTGSDVGDLIRIGLALAAAGGLLLAVTRNRRRNGRPATA